jgi:hypothetical protein
MAVALGIYPFLTVRAGILSWQLSGSACKRISGLSIWCGRLKGGFKEPETACNEGTVGH